MARTITCRVLVFRVFRYDASMTKTVSGDGVPFSVGTEYTLTAGWRYKHIKPDGHFAYDLAVPIGTPVYSPADGYVVALHDGVEQNRSNEALYSGKPSNWVITKHKLGYAWVWSYWQHLQKGINLKPGQKIYKGDLIAHTGLTGNTHGPHLHWALSSVPLSGSNRYGYMANAGANAIFPPTRLKDAIPIHAVASAVVEYPGKPLSEGSEGDAVRAVQKALGVETTGFFGPKTKSAVRKFQLKRPRLWPADGIVGPLTYAAIMSK